MTIQECYERLGGSYAGVSARIPSAKLIEKFVGKFLEDQSYEVLCSKMQEGDREEAFRAAHTLKGVCANLSFDRLQDSAGRLTEILRAAAETIPQEAYELLPEVKKDYEETTAAIRDYFA